ncbi:L-ribulose-5-phosphate 4-epimerase [Campylobacter lari]|uniref:L-ribulose-5-phosphate 4-epimerase n=1 Tax=Campylobacter lari TaxID=201 RepID=UPI002149A766|nr:L-ribulose-5-phosphate 4-epimerase [Campylobacter lari]EAJ6141805.1 L-ribulose-5-phosphate 4-epimerase [Campylobacter lari]EJB6606623.1 L-ribulose-5-phosphate 4-epimerase [Campylobacter lari]MCR2081009.1 L-ribulose-5-phosphate 4-epimerase [Campylobacter lari subsp. concheus]
MLEELKEKVCQANIELWKSKIVIFTWGNVSEIDDDGKFVVIKPSGVKYEKMKPEDMVVVDLYGNVIEGNYKPSSDTNTHLVLYRNFTSLKSIAHTHSTYATAFAQAGICIEPLGTTQADYFCNSIQVTRELSKEEVEYDYELNTGKVIIEKLEENDIVKIPAILVRSHGPFIFGTNASNVVHNAVVLEEIAKMNYITLNLNPNVNRISDFILNKHYQRKHGIYSYYGQK